MITPKKKSPQETIDELEERNEQLQLELDEIRATYNDLLKEIGSVRERAAAIDVDLGDLLWQYRL